MFSLYRLFDTPGLFDTQLSDEDIRNELKKVVYENPKGIHVFLYVHNPSTKFTKEEQDCKRRILVSRYTTIHRDANVHRKTQGKERDRKSVLAIACLHWIELQAMLRNCIVYAFETVEIGPLLKF